MQRLIPVLLLLAGLLTFVTGCTDTALVAPDAETAAVVGAADARAPAPGAYTIAELVSSSASADDPEFTLLLAALEYAGLTDVFAGRDQYTVFAPTDAAFGDLVTAVEPLLDPDVLAGQGPFAAIDHLLGDGTVAAVLLYHVTEGRRAANSVVPPRNPRTIMTLGGGTFTVDSSGSIRAVGSSATIERADLSARNGIVHVIDAVLLPIDLGL